MQGDYLPYIILTLSKDRTNIIPPTWFQLGWNHQAIIQMTLVGFVVPAQISWCEWNFAGKEPHNEFERYQDVLWVVFSIYTPGTPSNHLLAPRKLRYSLNKFCLETIFLKKNKQSQKSAEIRSVQPSQVPAEFSTTGFCATLCKQGWQSQKRLISSFIRACSMSPVFELQSSHHWVFDNDDFLGHC